MGDMGTIGVVTEMIEEAMLIVVMEEDEVTVGSAMEAAGTKAAGTMTLGDSCIQTSSTTEVLEGEADMAVGEDMRKEEAETVLEGIGVVMVEVIEDMAVTIVTAIAVIAAGMEEEIKVDMVEEIGEIVVTEGTVVRETIEEVLGMVALVDGIVEIAVTGSSLCFGLIL